MTYRTSLVHLDDSAHSDARIEFALELAERYDAHLIGLYVVCQDMFGPLVKTRDRLRLALIEAQARERSERARARFLAAGQRAARAVEWRAPEGAAVEVTTLHARHADLVIVGQHNPDDPASWIARHFPDDVVMACGRPVIVLPHAGHVRSFADNVLIAWDGSREAARALADALPLLRHARFVTVTTVNRPHGEDRPQGIDVAAFLQRHGIEASFAILPRLAGVSTGKMLLDRMSDLHVNLLVMGAYGHRRIEERVLGGVTRTLLETMTVPVLMSH
ncbi:MAG TPA: universal stress protein [Paraburkholderia sp.]|nr:universal stress protein [Paraburkholderia sp.]